jgi:hypothetical protein
MRGSMKSLRTGALATILAAGTIAATATVASADVACNAYGECWHTGSRYAVTVYPPGLGIQFYGDDWRKAHEKDTHYHWMKNRDDDHGYYSHGEWHAFAK